MSPDGSSASQLGQSPNCIQLPLFSKECENWSDWAFLVLASILPSPGPPWSSRSKEHRLNHLAPDQISQEPPTGTSKCPLRVREAPSTAV